jgi:hypothetical protein
MSAEHEAAARRYLGKPVMVYGEADFDAAGNPREMVNVTKIEPFSEIQVQRIFSTDTELKLSSPLTVAVDFRDDHWVMEHEDLGIIATDSDYEKCFRDFNDEFLFVWNEYGNADEAALTSGALELKKKIISVVRGPQ